MLGNITVDPKRGLLILGEKKENRVLDVVSPDTEEDSLGDECDPKPEWESAENPESSTENSEEGQSLDDSENEY